MPILRAQRPQLIGGGPLLYVSGKYIANTRTTAAPSTAAIPFQSRIWFEPLTIYRTVSLDRIACWMATAGGASDVVRLGIYNSNLSTGLPSTVAVDAGTQALTGSAAAKEATISVTLQPGQYWLAIQSGNGSTSGSSTAAIRTLTTSGVLPDVAGHTAPVTGTPQVVTAIWYDPAVNVTSTALPDMSAIAASSYTYDIYSVQYMIWCRVA